MFIDCGRQKTQLVLKDILVSFFHIRLTTKGKESLMPLWMVHRGNTDHALTRSLFFTTTPVTDLIDDWYIE